MGPARCSKARHAEGSLRPHRAWRRATCPISPHCPGPEFGQSFCYHRGSDSAEEAWLRRYLRSQRETMCWEEPGLLWQEEANAQVPGFCPAPGCGEDTALPPAGLTSSTSILDFARRSLRSKSLCFGSRSASSSLSALWESASFWRRSVICRGTGRPRDRLECSAAHSWLCTAEVQPPPLFAHRPPLHFNVKLPRASSAASPHPCHA